MRQAIHPATIENALTALPGVVGATANLGMGTARVDYLAGTVTPGVMIDAIEAAGYGATLADDPSASAGEDAAGEERAAPRRRVLTAAAFALPLVVIAMGRHLPGGAAWFGQLLPERAWIAVEWVLATPIVLLLPYGVLLA